MKFKYLIYSSLLLSSTLFATSGETLYQKCIACHGINADKIYANKIPALIEHDKETLIQMLKEYKTGDRNNYNMGHVMTNNVKAFLQTDEDIQKVVNYIHNITIRKIEKNIKEINQTIKKYDSTQGELPSNIEKYVDNKSNEKQKEIMLILKRINHLIENYYFIHGIFPSNIENTNNQKYQDLMLLFKEINIKLEKLMKGFVR